MTMNEPHPISPASALRRGLTDFYEQARDDSYMNFATGLGMPGTDKTLNTFYLRERLLQPTELQNMYTSNAYATRIVDRVVDDATRVDWYLTGTDKKFDWSSVKSQVDDIGGLSAIGDAWRWARLFGGGLAVMPIDDGQHFSKPLDLNNAVKIRPLTTLDSTTTMVLGFMAALGSVAWSEPTGYQVMAPVKGQSGFATIHPSRVIRFDGCRVPAAMLVNNGGWAPSVLQRCKKQLEAYGSVYGYAQNILHDISVMLVKLEGFNAMLLGDSGTSNAREILRQLRWGIDNLNLFVIDKGSDYQEVKRSVEGLEKLILAFERDLVGASGMSRLILTGEQASGLGASSSDEIRSWYADVAVQQKWVVTPALNRLLEVIFAIRRNAGEQVPTEWTIRYEALWTPEPKARAEIAEIWVRTINEAQTGGLMDGDEGYALLVRNGVLEDLPEADDTDDVPGPNDLEVDPTATATPAEEGASASSTPAEPEGPNVAEQALNGAQVSSLVEILEKVSMGTLAPQAAEWVIGQAVPAAMATESKRAATKAAIAAAAPVVQAPAPVVSGQAPADAEGEPEPDPIDELLAEIPGDLMTPAECVAEIKRRTNMEVSVHLVHALAKRHGVRSGYVGNARGYSLGDIKRALAASNGLELPAVEPEPEDTTDAADRTDGQCSLTVSIRPPRSISQWVPYNPDNPHPPHVTIIHVKAAWPRQAAALTEALQAIARTLAPVPITTASVGYFDHETQRIAWSGVDSPDLGALHELAVEAATVVGLEVTMHESGYHPHMTLAQLDPGQEYTGAAPPVGSTWDADALVVEYDGTCTILPLAGNAAVGGAVAPT
jgi:phage-related protein (TIGR01555 family)